MTTRIGYVLKKFPRLSETFVLNEILGVEAAGIEVTVCALRPSDDEPHHAALDRLQADIVAVDAPRFAVESGLAQIERERGVEAAAAAAAFVAALPDNRGPKVLRQGLAVAAEVRHRQLTHLHAHFVTVAAHTAYLAHLATGVPFTVTAHAKDIYRHGVDPAIFAEVVAAATGLVTVCEANEQHIRRVLLAGAPCRVVVIPNGLPLDDLPPPQPPASRSGILAVGRLVEKKGFDILVEAAALLRDRGRAVPITIIGAGDRHQALHEQIQRLGLDPQVQLAGPLPREEVLRRMAGGRLLAVPCVTGADGNRDALPTVVIEAMACGLPVVATPVGGIGEMVRHGREGLLVPEHDVEALADALAEILDHDDLWAQLSAAGPQRVAERFRQDTTLPMLLELFRAGGGL